MRGQEEEAGSKGEMQYERKRNSGKCWTDRREGLLRKARTQGGAGVPIPTLFRRQANLRLGRRSLQPTTMT